ncbi:hypothetical protein GCM10010233_65650 [Streptomyces pseudogriseolus]|nr:hypothetical protein GCM10010233_65650 [Streptomyces gancidicus]
MGKGESGGRNPPNEEGKEKKKRTKEKRLIKAIVEGVEIRRVAVKQVVLKVHEEKQKINSIVTH